jgi:hypothetical protein
VPKLTSERDCHNITGLNAAPPVTGTTSVPDADVPRTASEPDTSHDALRFGAQLDSRISVTTTAEVWSSTALFMIAPDPCEGKCSPELDVACRFRAPAFVDSFPALAQTSRRSQVMTCARRSRRPTSRCPSVPLNGKGKTALAVARLIS